MAGLGLTLGLSWPLIFDRELAPQTLTVSPAGFVNVSALAIVSSHRASSTAYPMAARVASTQARS